MFPKDQSLIKSTRAKLNDQREHESTAFISSPHHQPREFPLHCNTQYVPCLYIMTLSYNQIAETTSHRLSRRRLGRIGSRWPGAIVPSYPNLLKTQPNPREWVVTGRGPHTINGGAAT